MYSVLIVEDEPLARESLKYVIDWEAYGFQIRAEAEDGRRALELMQRNHYSLVLTDIRMPTMNGLELIAKLREFTDVPVIILSGYEDFEYARQALKMGVHDYLLKPVEEEELIAILERMGQSISEKRALQRQHHLGLTALRDQVLRKLAHGPLSRSEYEDAIRMIGSGMGEGPLRTLLVEMDSLSSPSPALTEHDAELKRYAVRNILEELCVGRGLVFEITEERYGIVMIGQEDGADGEGLVRFAGQLRDAVAVNAKETISIGIGSVAASGRELAGSFAAAEEALDGKFLVGSGSILVGRNAVEHVVGSGSGSEDGGGGGVCGSGVQRTGKLQSGVLEAISNLQDEQQVEEAIERLWEGFKAEQAPGSVVRKSVLELLVQLQQLVRELGASADGLFEYELGDYERVMKCKTMEELQLLASRKAMDVRARLCGIKQLQPNTLVTTVKKLVQEQYHTNISLRSIAQQVFLNPNYLGKMFKAGTDESFNDYLLKVRMEKAKELLRQSDKKVYEIAEAVGYGELDWFYKRFKSYAGMSAGEYRMKG
ncbi:response regulator [Paenibacillus sp. CF384]|uniref:response regulator transcription factor n=1 Tax=Paenibacillus sp. CF384 TaxID=1884382 RepID=UPI00089C5813|nr:response regulator [Paenibacillus sp. CF384]SDX45740.1 two-component system, response regulator YesN [Paenibacillus sp. CF384]